MNKIRLVKEKVFEEYIKEVNIHLKESITVLSKLHNGVDEFDYRKALENLDLIYNVLESLSQKKFIEVKHKTTILKLKNKED